MGFRRWLDPPEVRARKQQLRAAGLHPGRSGLTVTEVGVVVPLGCTLPLAIAAAVLVGAGVLAGAQLGRTAPTADSVVVRVIDDGAKGGPKVLSTQVVPLR